MCTKQVKMTKPLLRGVVKQHRNLHIIKEFCAVKIWLLTVLQQLLIWLIQSKFIFWLVSLLLKHKAPFIGEIFIFFSLFIFFRIIYKYTDFFVILPWYRCYVILFYVIILFYYFFILFISLFSFILKHFSRNFAEIKTVALESPCFGLCEI